MQKGLPSIQEMLANAIRHHQAGHLNEAERLYRQVLAVDPRHADSLHLLGVIAHQLGRHDLAVDLISKAIALDANVASYHSNMGNALTGQGKLDEAVVFYRKALALKPDYAEAQYNLGVLLDNQGWLDEAVACYRRAVELRPEYAEAHNNLGSALQDQGRLDEAVACYRKALDLKPDYPEAYYNIANVLRELGRLTEGRDYIEKAIRLSPRNSMFFGSLALSKQFMAGDPHLALMEELARDMESLSAKEQIELHFALGKALADIKEYEQSFRHLLQGNALKRQQIAYDATATLELFQRIQTVFTSEMMHRKQGLGNPSTVPIFIVGMPRSGTTLVEQILASHPKVFGAGERNDFDKAVAHLGNRARMPFPELVRGMSGEDVRQLGTSYLDMIRAIAPEAVRITDKMPLNFRFVGLIHLALPHARIIHTSRDPIDTCLSCFSTLFTVGQPYSYDLGELGRYYRAYQELMQHWRNVLPAGVMLEVQYEEVVDDLEGQARRLVAHCGLEWDDACLEFHKTQRPVRTASVSQVRQPIYKSAVGRWRVYEKFLGPLTKALTCEQLSR